MLQEIQMRYVAFVVYFRRFGKVCLQNSCIYTNKIPFYGNLSKFTIFCLYRRHYHFPQFFCSFSYFFYIFFFAFSYFQFLQIIWKEIGIMKLRMFIYAWRRFKAIDINWIFFCLIQWSNCSTRKSNRNFIN